VTQARVSHLLAIPEEEVRRISRDAGLGRVERAGNEERRISRTTSCTRWEFCGPEETSISTTTEQRFGQEQVGQVHGTKQIYGCSYKLAEEAQSGFIGCSPERWTRRTTGARRRVAILRSRKEQVVPTRSAALASEANQDFAGLLEDLHSTLSEHEGRAPDRQINDLLMRAVRCATNSICCKTRWRPGVQR